MSQFSSWIKLNLAFLKPNESPMKQSDLCRFQKILNFFLYFSQLLTAKLHDSSIYFSIINILVILAQLDLLSLVFIPQNFILTNEMKFLFTPVINPLFSTFKA